MKRFIFISLWLASTSLLALKNPPEGVVGSTLTEKEWQSISKLLDTKLSKLFTHGIKYLHPQKTGISCPIERDPKSGRVYIHLSEKPNSFLGKGCYKKVTKSILYKDKPILVAHCEIDQTGFKEVEILKKLQGVEGVVKLYSFIKRSSFHCDMILEYCNSGNLLKSEYDHIDIAESDYFQLFDDIISAVHGIHEKGYMHRDLHRGNILLTREGRGPLRARITDFGQTIPLKGDKNQSVVITKSNSPPETFLTRHAFIDRRKAEAYAVGVTLYIIMNSRRPSWTNTIQAVRVNEISKEKRVQEYREVVKQWTESYEALHPNTYRDELAILVHKLMNPNPKYRLGLKEAKSLLLKLKKKYK